MDERVWRLPGPRSFVRDIVAEHARGRHVTTVLPEALASDVLFTDGLAVAVQDEFVRQSVPTRRIYSVGADLSILDTVLLLSFFFFSFFLSFFLYFFFFH